MDAWVTRYPCLSRNGQRCGRAGCVGTRAYCLSTYGVYRLGARSALLSSMRDTLRLCLAIIGAFLAACFTLNVLRFVTISADARGVCAGFVGYLVGDCIARGHQSGRGRRKR